jgi:hypothetical protein
MFRKLIGSRIARLLSHLLIALPAIIVIIREAGILAVNVGAVAALIFLAKFLISGIVKSLVSFTTKQISR